jgi:hypothetical protein
LLSHVGSTNHTIYFFFKVYPGWRANTWSFVLNLFSQTLLLSHSGTPSHILFFLIFPGWRANTGSFGDFLIFSNWFAEPLWHPKSYNLSLFKVFLGWRATTGSFVFNLFSQTHLLSHVGSKSHAISYFSKFSLVGE